MLSRYRVIDLTDERGHLAGLMMRSLGADVIVVEAAAAQTAVHGPAGRPGIAHP